MPGGITFKLGAIDAGAAKRLKELNEETKKGGDNAKRASREFARMEAAARRAFERGLTPAERLKRKQEEINIAVRRGTLTQEQAAIAMRGTEKAGRGVASQIGKIAAGYFTANTAIQLVNQSLRVGIELEKERQNLAKDLTDASLAFAILNRDDPEGARADVLATARRVGFPLGTQEQRNVAFDAAQALQSSLGREEKESRAGLDTVLRAARVGFSVDLAKELVVQGKAQGLDDPLQLLRFSQIGGELSGRDPNVIAEAVKVFGGFEDKGFATAASVAIGNVRAEQIKAFLQGFERSITDPTVRKNLGISTEATQKEAFLALAARLDPKDTASTLQEQLEGLGIRGIREVQGLRNVLLFGKQELLELESTIEREGTPGLFKRRREELDKRDRLFAAQTRANEALAKQVELEGGELSIIAAEERAAEVERGLKLRSLGRDRLPFGLRRLQTIEEGGGVSDAQKFIDNVTLRLGGVPSTEFEIRRQQAIEKQFEAARRQEEAAASLSSAADGLNDSSVNIGRAAATSSTAPTDDAGQ